MSLKCFYGVNAAAVDTSVSLARLQQGEGAVDGSCLLVSFGLRTDTSPILLMFVRWVPMMFWSVLFTHCRTDSTHVGGNVALCSHISMKVNGIFTKENQFVSQVCFPLIYLLSFDLLTHTFPDIWLGVKIKTCEQMPVIFFIPGSCMLSLWKERDKKRHIWNNNKTPVWGKCIHKIAINALSRFSNCYEYTKAGNANVSRIMFLQLQTQIAIKVCVLAVDWGPHSETSFTPSNVR